MNEFNKKFLVTIDTEPDCDRHWNRSNPLTFSSISQGIPQFLRPLWDKYHINPIYFISPEVVAHSASVEVLRTEMKKGAIIGAHLHSEYIGPEITITDPAGKPSTEYPCYAHSKEIEEEKIEALTLAIQKQFGVRPEWYRAARYGADLDTIHALKKLGYKYDSSVTPQINWKAQGGPDHRPAPLAPYWISPDNYYQACDPKDSLGVQEYPITILNKRLGGLGRLLPDKWVSYNWLRPTLMSVKEQIRLIKNVRARNANTTLVMMFHSMEIMPGKSPYVLNKFMQNRFLRNLEKVLEYLCGSDFAPTPLQKGHDSLRTS